MASNSNSISLNVGDAIEYTESTTVTLEWTLRGLKQLFDSSKGEMKSKVTKSVKFGGGRWQVLFYANSGHEGGNYVSLYLSCEPAEDEKERSVNGKQVDPWIREGLFKFSFEIRNVNRGALTSPKEACDHSFSYKTANWGWAQFAKRDAVFYTPNTVRHVDAFLVICNITSASAAPSAVSPTPVRTVPRGLLDAVGDMLDDPTYSDVCFVLPAKKRRGVRGKVGKPKTIYAARKILQRVDYFHTMFSSGFAEGITDGHNAGKISNGAYRRSYRGADSISLSVASGDYGYDHEDNQEDDYDGYTDYWSQDPFEDSDEDSSDEEFDASGDHDPPSNHQEAVIADVDEESPGPQTPAGDLSASQRSGRYADDLKRSSGFAPRNRSGGHSPHPRPIVDEAIIPGPKKTKVIVKECEYATYYAVLYYLYTDSIVFSPLTSDFTSKSTSASPTGLQNLPDTVRSSSSGSPQGVGVGGEGFESPHRSRKEWIRSWAATNPGRPRPCSAKACYRLADKLGLTELKARAFQHIVKSLSVNNISFEIFSSFSAAFEDVRKVQVDFFLANWSEIKSSEAMRDVFRQVRLGRHPGFGMFWPLIIMNLEFVPRPLPEVGVDGPKDVLPA
ncbi:uncharacterized protein EI90DRAFT_2913451 [Cantharellus anzutake]|uniref:uncharacterized protein n=1 Tax=Cantharellus anzutake TaxID=1750568 RepID=UPI0019051228|nr:uncharacterized protein EI90DRAFT_2913451 [Cantharellus anzutake]KAF8335328.1 hypothetical protein EI90DRAFT_2913451 [Cantharellus anzutake]